MTLSRLIVTVALAAMLAAPLAACGRKNPPRPPAAEEQKPAQAPAS